MAENKKRLAIFIDGSNLYFKLKSLEIKNLSRFNFRGLVEWLARGREIIGIGYYVGVVRAKPNDEKGQKMRRAQIKINYDPREKGRFLAIEIDSQKEYLGNTSAEALELARQNHPNKVFYVVKIGFDAAETMAQCFAKSKK